MTFKILLDREKSNFSMTVLRISRKNENQAALKAENDGQTLRNLNVMLFGPMRIYEDHLIIP